MGGVSPGLKALTLLLTFPRPEGFGSLRCDLWSVVLPTLRKEREWTGHIFSCGLKLPEKQILHFAYPTCADAPAGPQTRSVQDDTPWEE
jgi:hypothetical protein